jgi:hypothetical protein
MILRELSPAFMDGLKNTNGLLYPILERVKQDHTLMLAIRKNYVNIYYRGGNILNVKEQRQGAYLTSFDAKYNITGKAMSILPKVIQFPTDAQTWADRFARLKEIMDIYFGKKGKSEREFQQMVARENNNSVISSESEYFISDIEFTVPKRARLDMLAIRWLKTQRKSGKKCRAALIEMKYSDGALDGKAGLLKHLKDIDALVSDKDKYQSLLKTMESQFNQLDELGLMKFKHSKKGVKVELSADEKPEVIFVLANHNPRSTKLSSILNDPKVTAYEQSQRFDLRFFVSSFAGYGLHSGCMLTLTQFQRLLSSNAK